MRDTSDLFQSHRASANNREAAPILVAGLGLHGAQGLYTMKQSGLLPQLLQNRSAVCGGKKTLNLLSHLQPDFSGNSYPITADIAGLMTNITKCLEEGHTVLVLADGDPLYFGIGSTLLHHFPSEIMAFLPAVSSMQAAAARLGISWHAAVHLSLHGRDAWGELACASLQEKPIFLLLDHRTAPADIATFLCDRGRDGYTLHLMTELDAMAGAAAHATATLCDLATGTRNIATQPGRSMAVLMPLLDAHSKRARLCLGLPDDAYAHESGLITKQAVRAASVASLRLKRGDTVWDLGAGSGSVGLESSVLACEGAVHAVEQRASRVECILKNRKIFGAANLEVHGGNIWEILPTLPPPDAIFWGGGLGDSSHAQELLQTAWSRLRPGGRMTAACVLLDTLAACLHVELPDQQVPARITQIQAAEGVPLAGSVRLKGGNPVTLVTWEKSYGTE